MPDHKPDAAGNDVPDTAMDDIKAKMRDALERKKGKERGVAKDQPLREKAHGSEIDGAGPKMHRRKAGGGGA